MQLKARMDECMIQNCEADKQTAESIAKRFNIQSEEQARAAVQYDADAESFAANKTWSMSDIMQYQRYEDCFNQCQRPIRMFQLMLKQNMIIVGKN